LFAKRSFKKGDTIFIEKPLVSSQFLWNALYKYRGKCPINYYPDILDHILMVNDLIKLLFSFMGYYY